MIMNLSVNTILGDEKLTEIKNHIINLDNIFTSNISKISQININILTVYSIEVLIYY